MSSRRSTSDTTFENESKYSDDRIHRDKDDSKQQMKERRDMMKQPELALIEQLQRKVETTDYGESTGTPNERLEHLSKDVNAIVAERERLAIEKEKEEEAQWQREEDEILRQQKSSRQRGTEPQTMKIQASMAGNKMDRWESMGELPSDRKSKIDSPSDDHESTLNTLASSSPDLDTSVLDTVKTKWHDAKESIDTKLHHAKESIDTKIHDVKDSIDTKLHGAKKSTDTEEDRETKFKLDEVKNRPEPKPHHEGERWSRFFSRIPADNHLSNTPPGVDKTVVGEGRPDFRMEKDSMDITKAERAEQWRGYTPLRDDPDNYRGDDHWTAAHAGSITSTLPHGEVRRTKQSSSSAFSPVSRAMEDSDPTRTHTRFGRDRVIELGKEDAILNQEDFEKNAAANAQLNRESPLSSRIRTIRTPIAHHDFLESAGEFFTKGGVKEVPQRDSDLAFDQSKPLERAMARTVTTSSLNDKSSRIVLPPQLPPDSRVTRREGVIESAKDKLSDAKSKVESKLESAKDKIEGGFEKAKDKVESGYDKTKSTLALGYEKTKDKMEEGIDTTKEAIVGGYETVKDKIEDSIDATKKKASNIGTKIENKASEVKQEVKQEAKELKQEAKELKQEGEAKWRTMKKDVAEVADDTKATIESGAYRLRDKASRGVDEVEKDAESAASRARESWWNPLNHLPWQTVKERHATVDSSPDGVKITPLTRQEEAKLKQSLSSSTSPKSNSRWAGVNPIHVPDSLRGLEDTVYPGPPNLSLDLDARKQAKEAKSTSSPKTTLFNGTAIVTDIPIYVPNSLRGLESNELPSGEISIRKRPVHEIDVNSPLRPKEHGLLSNLTHAFDKKKEATYPGTNMTRTDKLYASARDEWDLRALDGRSPSPSPRSPSPAQSLKDTLKDDRSTSPVPFEAKSPSSYSIEQGSMYSRSILEDPTFRELMVEMLE